VSSYDPERFPQLAKFLTTTCTRDLSKHGLYTWRVEMLTPCDVVDTQKDNFLVRVQVTSTLASINL